MSLTVGGDEESENIGFNRKKMACHSVFRVGDILILQLSTSEREIEVKSACSNNNGYLSLVIIKGKTNVTECITNAGMQSGN